MILKLQGQHSSVLYETSRVWYEPLPATVFVGESASRGLLTLVCSRVTNCVVNANDALVFANGKVMRGNSDEWQRLLPEFQAEQARVVCSEFKLPPVRLTVAWCRALLDNCETLVLTPDKLTVLDNNNVLFSQQA